MGGGFIIILFIYILGLLSEATCAARFKERDAALDKGQELYCVRFIFLCSLIFSTVRKSCCTVQNLPEKFRLLDLEAFSIL